MASSLTESRFCLIESLYDGLLDSGNAPFNSDFSFTDRDFAVVGGL